MVVIVDYNTGNLGSIQNMLKKIGHKSVISSGHSDIENATKLILPGVGAFDYGVTQLRQLGLLPLLNKKVIEERTPLLGICLGAQLCCLASEEGVLPGLGWIQGKVRRFPGEAKGRKYPVPHMGWDLVQPLRTSKLYEGLEQDARFYFVHSYFIDCTDNADAVVRNEYSCRYEASFEKDNILGVQFHPEKSHKFGQRLLRNFIENY